MRQNVASKQWFIARIACWKNFIAKIACLKNATFYLCFRIKTVFLEKNMPGKYLVGLPHHES